MGISITQLRGTTASMIKTLKSQGLGNVDALLLAARTPLMRRKLAQMVGTTPQHILAIANRADLSRIKGVAGTYCDLLELAGVGSVRTLAKQKKEHLHEALIDINQRHQLCKVPPSSTRVCSWIEQAKTLKSHIRT